MSRRSVTAAAFALASTASLVVLAPQAEAVVAGTCKTSTSVASFSPGITTTAKVVTTTITAGKVSGCSGDAAIPTATGTFTGKLTSTAAGQSCTTGTATGTLTIKWADGQITKIAATQKPNTATTTPFDVILTGRVTAGPGLAQKATIRTLQALTPVTGNCLLTPLTKTNLSGAITINKP